MNGDRARSQSEPPTQSVVVVCDSRESRSGIAQQLATFPGIQVEQAELDCGDYRVEDLLVVERKSATDFVLSIMDGRLFEQAAKMSAGSATSVLLLEGDPLETRSAIEPASIVGAMSALPLFFGVSVLRSSSVSFSAMLISTMARQATMGLGYEIRLRAQKPKGAGLIGQFLAEGLPGVGPTTARKLLDHFGTPRALFEASTDSLRAVRGVGPKLAADIAAALDTSHRDWLSTKGRAKRQE